MGNTRRMQRAKTAPIAVKLRRVAAATVVAALAWVLGMFLNTSVAGSALLLAPLERSVPAVTAEPSPDDQAIVVLTGRLERGDKAAEAHGVSGLPVFVAGDPVNGMARHLQRKWSLEPRWVDRRSVDTESNASTAACVLQHEGIRSIALVTDTWHMLRSELWFRYYGFQVTPAPARVTSGPGSLQPSASPQHWPATILPSSLGRARARVARHEWSGIAKYLLIRASGRRISCAPGPA